MKQIKKLKIGGHIIKVLWEKDPPQISGKMGDAWVAYNSIRISLEHPESQQESCLLHEILHHIMHNLGYEKNTEPNTEKTIEALAESLYQVLKDNKLKFF